MKNKLNIASLLLAAAFICPANAQETKDTDLSVKVAVVDLNAVQENSTIYKKIKEQVAGYAKTYQADIAKEETALETDGKKLQTKIATTKDDAGKAALIKEVTAHNEKMNAFRKKVDQMKRAIDVTRLKALIKAKDEALSPVIGKLAEKHGANLVIDSSQLIMFKPTFNITEEVISEINKKPVINVAKPEITSSTSAPADKK